MKSKPDVLGVTTPQFKMLKKQTNKQKTRAKIHTHNQTKHQNQKKHSWFASVSEHEVQLLTTI